MCLGENMCRHRRPPVEKRVKYEESYSILGCGVIYWCWVLNLGPCVYARQVCATEISPWSFCVLVGPCSISLSVR